MSIILLYVDAENLSKEEINDCVLGIKSSHAISDKLIGKFYGGLDATTPVLSLCYNLGLEYVETSSLNKGSKNIADMKIVVDCIEDVFSLKEAQHLRVIILSKDCDFIPLAYKLFHIGVSVEMPLLDLTQEVLRISDIEKVLADLHFDPASQGYEFCLSNQYEYVRKLLPEKFSDELIYKFFDRKKNRFLKAIRPYCDENNFASLISIPADKIDFHIVLEHLASSCDVTNLLRLYTSKYYGFMYPEHDINNILKII